MDSFKKRLLALMHDTARPMLSMHSHVELIRKLGVSPEVDEHLQKMVERTRQVTGHLDKFYTDCTEIKTIIGISPNEKVIELLAKFSVFQVGQISCQLTLRESTQCSIFVCDEILNESKMKFCGQGITDQHYKFWEDVKAILIATQQRH